MLESDEAINLLIGALTDNRLEIRRAAREILEGFGTDRAIKALNDAPLMMMVKRMNEGVASKVDALIYIGKAQVQGRPAAGPQGHERRIQERPVRGGEGPQPHAGQGLDQHPGPLINDPYFDIRLEAVKALEHIVDHASLKPLEKAREDLNKSVREEAKKAYYTLQTKLGEMKK